MSADEVIEQAASIRVEALLQLGNMLKEMTKNGGTKGQFNGRDISGGTKLVPPENTPTLSDLGLDKKTSKFAQGVESVTDATA